MPIEISLMRKDPSNKRKFPLELQSVFPGGSPRGSRRWPSGFSLVELLVVIAVIAIIAAVAIPNISNITENASSAKAMRNAQSLASAASLARTAGYATNWGTIENAIGVLTSDNGAGISVGSGVSAFQIGVSPLTESEITEVSQYLLIPPGPDPDKLIFLGPGS